MQGKARSLSKQEDLLLFEMKARRQTIHFYLNCNTKAAFPDTSTLSKLSPFLMPWCVWSSPRNKNNLCVLLLTQLEWGKASFLKPMRKGLCPPACAQDTKPSQSDSILSHCSHPLPALISKPLTRFKFGSTFGNHPYFCSFSSRTK